MAMREVAIHTDYIQLDQALKLAGVVASGGEAKAAIQDGSVLVNGSAETRRGKKLHVGDTIEFRGTVMHVVQAGGAKGIDGSDEAERTGPTERTGGQRVGKPDRAD